MCPWTIRNQKPNRWTGSNLKRKQRLLFEEASSKGKAPTKAETAPTQMKRKTVAKRKGRARGIEINEPLPENIFQVRLLSSLGQVILSESIKTD